jgi:hypothetical protein
MPDRDLDPNASCAHRLPQPSVSRAEETDVERSVTSQREPIDQVTCRAGDKSCATAHAATIDRATASQPGRAIRSLLQLQKQYGNQYVKQVLSLARNDPESSTVHPGVERAIQEQRGGGQSLDSGVRRHMEGAFGADFSGVRVHTGAQANTLNHSLSARAFTTGQDIFFREGAYQPGSTVGRELLAHELTHVVQQNGDQVRRKMSVSQPGDAHEAEAEHMARTVMQRELHSGPEVERQEEQPAMASRAAEVQRQPEAVKEDEEKKKHRLAPALEVSSLSRQTEEEKTE